MRSKTLEPTQWVVGILLTLCIVLIATPADARRRCRKDADCDGLTNQQERQLGTNRRSADTDRDGISDGYEVNVLSSDPTDRDSDDDGVDDGNELSDGSDPNDGDSDDDGIPDGADCDSNDDLDTKIEGEVQAITCPTADVSGEITILGISIKLPLETEFEEVTSCADITPGAHVEVEVAGDASTEIVAEKVEAEDTDHDGCVDDDEDDEDSDAGNDNEGEGLD